MLPLCLDIWFRATPSHSTKCRLSTPSQRKQNTDFHVKTRDGMVWSKRQQSAVRTPSGALVSSLKQYDLSPKWQQTEFGED
ncbi:unnamed protein product [Caretta caretta]